MNQHDFYRTAAWDRARDAYIQLRISVDGGMCERCGERLGYIVHHKKHLNDVNVVNPEIALSGDNFEYLCQECHNKEHHKKKLVLYRVGKSGEILPPVKN